MIEALLAANQGEDGEKNTEITLDLDDPMQAKINQMFKDVENIFNIQTSGATAASTTPNAQVLEVMQQARDIAKYSNEPTSSSVLDYTYVAAESSSSSSSSSDSDSYDSDD